MKEGLFAIAFKVNWMSIIYNIIDMGKIILLKSFIRYCVFVVVCLLRTCKGIIKHYLFSDTRIRRFVCDPNKDLIYLNNPKVACSSIKTSILGEQDDIHEFAYSYIVGTLTPELKACYSFTFVRNPYERLVSCFESKCMGDSPLFDTYLFGYLKGMRDFDTFVRRVGGIPFRLAEDHFRDQYGLVYNAEGVCLVHFVGKFENLRADFEPIRERFNLLPLPHMNRAASLTGKNWMDYYTLYTAELVYQKYKKDFIAFGYTDEYKKLKAYLKKKALKPSKR